MELDGVFVYRRASRSGTAVKVLLRLTRVKVNEPFMVNFYPALRLTRFYDESVYTTGTLLVVNRVPKKNSQCTRILTGCQCLPGGKVNER